MIYEVYTRYGERCTRKASSVESAIDSLTHDNEYGECFPIAVYNEESNELYVPDMEPADVHSSEYRFGIVRELCGLSQEHAFDAVHERSFFQTTGGC